MAWGTWDAQDETCGLCRMPFDASCPDCKLPEDDCPLRSISPLTEFFNEYLNHAPLPYLCHIF
ncbi:hypothetical protein AXX17_AT5G26580 [Arabidopsis thaliana]|uniref:Anaphase-promoting complex subunit 11 RING-H2 finger domain-containing protein n=1 Tax=Arabidopsis thaliana TaxID=3702 RepID=A0A178UDG5_ARATH|nr:hypothetical protein AXX17_AT5G26580 [Arabidopsis thaliana]